MGDVPSRAELAEAETMQRSVKAAINLLKTFRPTARRKRSFADCNALFNAATELNNKLVAWTAANSLNNTSPPSGPIPTTDEVIALADSIKATSLSDCGEALGNTIVILQGSQTQVAETIMDIDAIVEAKAVLLHQINDALAAAEADTSVDSSELESIIPPDVQSDAQQEEVIANIPTQLSLIHI